MKTEKALRQTLTHVFRDNGFRELMFTEDTLVVSPEQEHFEVVYRVV